MARDVQEEIVEEAQKLYSETVINQLKNPRNMGIMECPDGYGKGSGACRDSIEIFIRVKNGTIFKASFLTDGCVTTFVSASMAVEMAIGKTVQEAWTINQEGILEALGGLPAENEHCALLAEMSLREALRDYQRNEREPWKKLYR